MKLLRPVEVTEAVLTATNVAESEPLWNVATTYAKGAQVRGPGDYDHRLYESLQASNTGHSPPVDVEGDGEWWFEVGATNRWRPFDGSVTSQAENADLITYTLQIPAGSRIDSVAVLNVSAVTVSFTLTDSTEGVVYDEAFSLTSDSGITDPYAYSFEPIERVADLALTELPPYAGATLTVELEATGETVKLGALVIGLSRNLGDTTWGARVGVYDASKKERNSFGNFEVVERGFAKTASLTFNVAPGFTDRLQTLLAEYRATPTLYLGDEDFTSTIVYGFYREFAIEIALADHSVCSIEIEGLT